MVFEKRKSPTFSWENTSAFIASAILPSKETWPAHHLSHAHSLLCCIPSLAPSFLSWFAFQSVPFSWNSIFSNKYVWASLTFKILLIHLSPPSSYHFFFFLSHKKHYFLNYPLFVHTQWLNLIIWFSLYSANQTEIASSRFLTILQILNVKLSGFVTVLIIVNFSEKIWHPWHVLP